MKRKNGLYNEIISIENLELADLRARKGKGFQYGIRIHDRKRQSNILKLHEILLNGMYKTSPYTTFTIREPKERTVFRLPYYPDRIVHHAIMNILESLFVSTFTADTYSCIKGRGIHAAAEAVKRALKDPAETRYCLKLDIKKFYPNIDHDILKHLLRRKIKDRNLLSLLDEIIDSAAGVPIGNYLSQYFANYYLSAFDHWLKEVKGVKHYFRYCDDLVILSGSKEYLHAVLREIKDYLKVNLKLDVKRSHRVFPVKDGIDFVGYVFRHTYTRLRKSTKQSFARMLARRPNQRSIASYMGWTKHCNSRHLVKKLFNHA